MNSKKYTTARIEKAEAEAKQLEEGSNSPVWLKAADDYVHEFLERLPDAPMYIEPAQENPFSKPNFAEEGGDMRKALDQFREHVDKTGIHTISGNMFGYIPGGNLLPAAIGDFISAVTNRYSGVFFSSPGSVRMEHMLIRWMCNMVGYPPSALGNMVSGGSPASLVAIATARDHLQVRSRDVERSVVYLTSQAHHCIHKALRIAGLGEEIIRQVPVDEGFRMKPDALAQQIEDDLGEGLKPFLLVSSAGTTDTGAVDPLDDLADVAEKHGLWHHVDAAYGGFFMLTDEAKDKFKGIERSDSVTIDPHKGLFLPFGSGAVLIKNVEALLHTHHYMASYMQDTQGMTEEHSPADLGPELSRHPKGLRMWLPLKVFGLRPFRAALEEKILLCRYFYDKVKELGFETGPEPDLSIAMYRYVPEEGDANAYNERLVEAIRKDGRVLVSSTTINGVFWLRIAVLNFRTHREHVDRLLGVLREKANHL
ncbi:MAG: pyridoxal-dependent decarboxylase [Cyclobacteriaceae bacterium]